MKKRKSTITTSLGAVLLVLAAGACVLLLSGPRAYTPPGEATGDAALDEQVLALLQTLCDPRAAEADNLAAVYDWVRDEITYRPSAVDVSGGFTDELTRQLAAELLQKRRGNCDGEAALTAVLLRRMGCPAEIVQGSFRREDGAEVEHAWVIARVGGVYRHFDPLYDCHYAQGDDRACFLATDADLASSHSWQRADYPACE